MVSSYPVPARFTKGGVPMRLIYILSVLVSLTFYAASVQGQDRPFLFTVTSFENKVYPTFVHYDAAYGRQTFEPLGGDRVEQNLGIQASLGEMCVVIGHAGLAIDGGSSRASEQCELLVHLMNANESLIDVSAGAGVLHEYGGTNVILGRAALGRRFTSWQVYGNLLLEKALSPDRDNIDLTSTVGLSYQVAGAIHLGIEAVGQDLEGFWDPTEAEGGARLYFGPVIGVEFPGTPWNLTVGGGAIIRATQSTRISGAIRDLPTGGGNGFIFRSVLSFGL